MKPLMALTLLSCLMAPSLLAQTHSVTIVVEAGPDSEQTRLYYRRFADDNSHLLWMKSDGNTTYKKTFDDTIVKEGLQFLTQIKGKTFTAGKTATGDLSIPLTKEEKALAKISLSLEKNNVCLMTPVYN